MTLGLDDGTCVLKYMGKPMQQLVIKMVEVHLVAFLCHTKSRGDFKTVQLSIMHNQKLSIECGNKY